MKPSRKYTSLGGIEGRFNSTNWSVIEKIKDGDLAGCEHLLNDLLQAYWKPVYCYLRKKHFDNEEAKDLAQDFFHEIVLNRDLIKKADMARGRFRTLLLTALDHYVISLHRKQNAKKRIPPRKLIHLDDTESDRWPAVTEDFSSEETFNYVWVSNFLDDMLLSVEQECRQRGLTVHWQLFEERVLKPILENTDPPTLAEICTKHRIKDKTKASNMIFVVKKRFQATLRRLLRQSVASHEDMQEEMEDILHFLGRSGKYLS